MSEHTIEYRGYQIDPVHDPEETGAWNTCPVDQATFFMIFPPDPDAEKLDVEAYTLDCARRAIDIELGEHDPNWHHVETPMRVYDEDGESYELLMMFHVDHSIPDEEVEAWVKRNFASDYCRHSYDCCGNYYPDEGRHWRVPYTDRVVVHQKFRLNV